MSFHMLFMKSYMPTAQYEFCIYSCQNFGLMSLYIHTFFFQRFLYFVKLYVYVYEDNSTLGIGPKFDRNRSTSIQEFSKIYILQ